MEALILLALAGITAVTLVVIAVSSAIEFLRRKDWADGWMIFQFCVSVAAGSVALWWDDHQSTPGQGGSVLWGFVVGLFAARAVMFPIVWARFGWASARSMRMF